MSPLVILRRPWRILVLACLCPWWAAAAPPALSLDEAMALAAAHSQALPAQAAAAQAARERALAAAQRPDPVLRIGLDNVPVEGSARHLLTREPTTARSIGIVQALPDEAKRRARALGFTQTAALADVRQAAALSTLRREAALAWWAVHTQTQRLAVLAAQRDEATRLVQAAEAAYRAGRGGQADVFAARAAPARLDERRLQVAQQLADARSLLGRWIGDDAHRPLADAPPLDDSQADAQDLEAVATADPDLQTASAREALTRAAAQLAQEERRPDWSVDLRFAQRGPRYDNMVTIGLSLPLRWDLANRQDRELAARQAEALQTEAETVELRRERRAQIARWHQGWRSGLARLAVVDTQLVPLATARTDAALAAYRAGHGTLQAVLDARQAALALQLERLQIEADTASDAIRLTTLSLPPETAR